MGVLVLVLYVTYSYDSTYILHTVRIFLSLYIIVYCQRFCAKVVEKDEETQEVIVHFDGWSSRYDEVINISAGRLRPLTQELLLKTTRKRKPKVYKSEKMPNLVYVYIETSVSHAYLHNSV